MKLTIDTGSSDLVIPSITCINCTAKTKFNCSDSKTCKENKKKKYTITYDDGTIYTHQGFEKMAIRDINKKKFVNKN